MATKPLVLPRAWASNALYTTGPFIGQPQKVDPGVGVAAEGHRPGSLFPTAAEHENYQQDRITAWIRDWVFFGTSTTAQNAHIVETNANGRAGLHGLTVFDSLDETAVDITGSNTLAPTMTVTCAGDATRVQAELGNTAGTGFSATTNLGAATAFSAFMFGSPAGASGMRVTADAATAGVGMRVDHAGTGVAANFRHTGTPAIGAAVNVSCVGPGATAGIDSRGSQSGAGVRGYGNAFASANGVEGILENNLGWGLYGITASNASSASRGVKGWGRNTADGVEALVTGTGAALRVVATALATTAIYVPGKAGDSTNTFNGRADYNTVTETWVHSDQNASNYRDFWSSRGGLCIGGGVGGVTQSNGAWVTAATLILTGNNAPRRGGRQVWLVFTCDARTLSAVPNTVNVRIFDVTDDPVNPIASSVRSGTGTAPTAGFALTGVTTDWERTIHYPFLYTVPAAGDRTFRVEVQRATATSIAVRDGSLYPIGLF